MKGEARAYRTIVIDRFLNPFLEHRLPDIFVNHQAKKRRFGGLIERVNVNGLRVNQARLTAAPGGAEEAHGRKFG
jgi:mannitol-1-phosphate/altronate dehydrogenase